MRDALTTAAGGLAMAARLLAALALNRVALEAAQAAARIAPRQPELEGPPAGRAPGLVVTSTFPNLLEDVWGEALGRAGHPSHRPGGHT